MNQTNTSNNYRSTINSNYFTNQIDSSIVQLTRALAIEHSILPDPDAKNMARAIIQDHINVLISDETKAGIKKLMMDTVSKIKSGDEYASRVYELFKLMRLDHDR